MEKKNSIDLRWALVVFIVWLTAACSPTVENQSSHEIKKMEGLMNTAQPVDNTMLTLPTIDVAAPAAVATASFGLG